MEFTVIDKLSMDTAVISGDTAMLAQILAKDKSGLQINNSEPVYHSE